MLPAACCLCVHMTCCPCLQVEDLLTKLRMDGPADDPGGAKGGGARRVMDGQRILEMTLESPIDPQQLRDSLMRFVEERIRLELLALSHQVPPCPAAVVCIHSMPLALTANAGSPPTPTRCKLAVASTSRSRTEPPRPSLPPARPPPRCPRPARASPAVVADRSGRRRRLCGRAAASAG